MIRHWLPRLVRCAGRDAGDCRHRRPPPLPRTSSIARCARASDSGESQRVIVKAKPGYEAWARQLLAQRGKHIDAELPSIGALAVELTAGELDASASSAVVRRLLGRLLVSPSAQ